MSIFRKPGDTVVAMRPGDKWHGKEVSVTSVTGDVCTCLLFKQLYAALISKRGSKKRRNLKYRTFTHEELW